MQITATLRFTLGDRHTPPWHPYTFYVGFARKPYLVPFFSAGKLSLSLWVYQRPFDACLVSLSPSPNQHTFHTSSKFAPFPFRRPAAGDPIPETHPSNGALCCSPFWVLLHPLSPGTLSYSFPYNTLCTGTSFTFEFSDLSMFASLNFLEAKKLFNFVSSSLTENLDNNQVFHSVMESGCASDRGKHLFSSVNGLCGCSCNMLRTSLKGSSLC